MVLFQELMALLLLEEWKVERLRDHRNNLSEYLNGKLFSIYYSNVLLLYDSFKTAKLRVFPIYNCQIYFLK